MTDQEWPDHVRRYVQQRQEQAFFGLGDQLGIKGTPLEIQRAIFRHVPRGEDMNAVARLPGYRSLNEAELHNLQEQIDKSYTDASSMPLPTPYEDRRRYPVVAIVFKGIAAAMKERQKSVGPWNIVLATLPQGDVNAKIERVPSFEEIVLFFDQGLFQFLEDFCEVVAWAFPTMGMEEVCYEKALLRTPKRVDPSSRASDYFSSSLMSYLLKGSPLANPLELYAPQNNHFLCVVLNVAMLQFVIAHEFRHLEIGDLSRTDRTRSDWEREFDADSAALELVAWRTVRDGASSVVACCACYLTLYLFDILYRAMGTVHFGSEPLLWVDESHPDPTKRRYRLRSAALAEVCRSRLQRRVANHLFDMTDQLFEELWSKTVSSLMHGNAYSQLSPIWRDHVEQSLSITVESVQDRDSFVDE